MAADDQAQTNPTADCHESFARLRAFSGTPSEFWPAFIEACGRLCGAQTAVLLIKPSAQAEGWKKLGQWTGGGQADRYSLGFLRQLADLADGAAKSSQVLAPMDGLEAAESRHFAVAAALPLQRASELCVLALFIPAVAEPSAREALTRIRLVADTPVSYLQNSAATQARADVDKLATTLDIMAQMNAEKRYVAAALAFCNGLASKHRCDRVSLGWLEHGYIRLQAISRTEKFDRQMAAAKALETAMEEAFDQDEEIVWPQEAGATTVARDHEAYSKSQGAQHLCSVPLRLDDAVTGVLLCERANGAFNETELRQLRLAADQAVRRLSDLKREDRWFGARLAVATRKKLAEFLGIEHTWTKALVVLTSIALLVLAFVRVNYRVEANFIIHSDEVAFVAAPFDGFIDEVKVRVGDDVRGEQVTLQLAKDQLELDESAALADLTRFTREAEKARAGNALADMRIALALADQARSRLDLVRYRLDRSALKSPFNGVVVEGDQKERIGAPVKQGEMLFKIARTDHLYIEADVDERDVHEIVAKAGGEIAFASQPKDKFPIEVVRVRAAAQPKEGANVFIVRCAIAAKPEAWWRPGMSGVSKINVGKRSLLWIFTHRTVDYLRLLFWW